MDLVSLLKTVSIFRGIEPSLLSQLMTLLKRVELHADTTIFKEGQTADAFYIIEAGEIEIAKQRGPESGKVLAVLEQGSVFGEMAFFADAPRTATARTTRDSVLLAIRARNLRSS